MLVLFLAFGICEAVRGAGLELRVQWFRVFELGCRELSFKGRFHLKALNLCTGFPALALEAGLSGGGVRWVGHRHEP